MSWREVLGAVNPVDTPYTHNPHNTHKNPMPGNSANIADSAEGNSKLLEVLATATCSLPITSIEVRDALAPEDIDDWRKGNIGTETIKAFARSLAQRLEMDMGEVPAHFTERAICKQCGPVWLWFTGEALGCPWCWSRTADRPIPRPHPVCCGDCAHFERINHPNLGHCAKDKLEAIAGLWDTSQRYCGRYLSRPEQPIWRPIESESGRNKIALRKPVECNE
ncbi:MAG: hypothetical protein JMN27_12445 [gamma proteobacterium endosymbiont of Lamellibrachia anaximandri]|nr:hypothetical protein [gamma proteobacterium endosymbiont of Lamellibrachia anaximandri]MBL3534629.1 hypothetical protein [gamma proteobacterium endosymbiont of Lamellibrachia anaximandri]